MARSALLELVYLSVACTLDLTSCGFRVRRSRRWLLAILAPTSASDDGVRCQSIAGRVCKLLRMQCAFDADSLLVSRSSLSYLEYLNSFRNQRSTKKSNFSNSNPRWVALHERLWRKHASAEPTVLPTFLLQASSQYSLTRRETSLIHYDAHRNRQAFSCARIFH